MIVARDAPWAIVDALAKWDREVRAGRRAPLPARDGSLPMKRRNSNLVPGILVALLIAAFVAGVILAAVTGFLPAVFTGASSPASATPSDLSLIPIAQQSVVTVVAENPDGSPRSAGSGFFVTSDGRLLTNSHVVANAARVHVVTADGQSHPASRVAIDVPLDVAEFAIPNSEVPLKLARSGTRVGEAIYVLGNPLAQSPNSTATGRVTKIHAFMRSSDGRSYPDMINLDASVDHGNSGGPVINANGEVVGIATLGDSHSGFGSAIPVERFASTVAGWAVVTPVPYSAPTPVIVLDRVDGSCTTNMCTGSVGASDSGGSGHVTVTITFTRSGDHRSWSCASTLRVTHGQSARFECSAPGDFRAVGSDGVQIDAKVSSTTPD